MSPLFYGVLFLFIFFSIVTFATVWMYKDEIAEHLKDTNYNPPQ